MGEIDEEFTSVSSPGAITGTMLRHDPWQCSGTQCSARSQTKVDHRQSKFFLSLGLPPGL